MLGYIYKITNLINNKIYIGQTIDIKKRWSKHKSVARNKSYKYRSPLYDAINKYGIDNFKIDIIEKCDVKNLEEKEKYWIKKLDSLVPNGYNISIGGRKLFGDNNPFYKKHHTVKTKNILSKKNKGRQQSKEEREMRKIINKKERNPFYGKHHTEEIKLKIKNTYLKNNVYEKLSKKMKENNPNKNGIHSKKRKCKMLDLKTKTIIKEFNSLSDAGEYCRSLGLTNAKYPSNQIKDACNGYQKSAFGFLWEYINEDVSTNENN